MVDNRQKLVVITGGTKGIGRALVQKFSEHGFTVATCSRNERDLDVLKQEIEAKYGNRVLISVANVAKKKDAIDFIELVRLTGIPVEILINNAGSFVPGQIHTEEDGVLESQIETNLYSAYRISRGFIPDMKKAGRGHIFNLCSTASITAYSNGGSYCISKFALYGMSKVLREELKKANIRVTSVLPGATFTASWEGVDLPEDRFMPPEDVAHMIYAIYQLSGRSVVEDLIIRPQLGDL